MARSYAALTPTGISSALAYSRPLNWIMVLDLALAKRWNQCPKFAFLTTIFREIPVRHPLHSHGRSGLHALCLRGCRCSADRESLFGSCAGVGARHKPDRTLRGQAVPWLNRRARE